MARGVRGSSTTPAATKAAARSRVYYAEHAAELSWSSNAWNRTHKKEGLARSRAWEKKNPARAKELGRSWRKANQAHYYELRNIWYTKHPGYNALKSMECYIRGQERLAGRKKPKQCDVCHKEGKICFDHNHVFDVFRGWLCTHCNLSLGFTKDSAKILRVLALYLDKPLKNAIRITGHFTIKRQHALLGERPKKCPICRSTGVRICMDHCHKKMVFRGWLCVACNSALGHAHDSAKLLRKLADYLDNDKQKQKELKKNAKTKK